MSIRKSQHSRGEGGVSAYKHSRGEDGVSAYKDTTREVIPELCVTGVHIYAGSSFFRVLV